MVGQGQLIYDSSLIGAAVGARAAIATERRLCFRTRTMSVDLVVTHAGALQTIHGLVVDEPSGRPTSCASIRMGRRGESISINALGQFVTSSLAGESDQFLWVDTPEGSVLCSIPADVPLSDVGE